MPITIKRSPMVLFRKFAAIEASAFLLYLLATQFDSFKYFIYSQITFGVVSYDTLKIFLLFAAQLVITIYAFLNWHYEAYTLRKDSISHERGVFWRKTRTIQLDKSMSLMVSASPFGNLFHYGSLQINAAAHNSMVLKDISYPAKYRKLIENSRNTVVEHGEAPDVNRLLSGDEHEHLEFKSSLRFDVKNGKVNHDLEKAAMKTVAAFLNTQGGHLVLGVDNARNVLGLKQDYGTIQVQNSDGFENHFTQVFNNMIGPEFRQFIKLYFHKIGESDVCVVKVAPSARPAYLKNGNEEHFYVRTGNISTPLKLSEVESYAVSRWPRRAVSR
jgi:membrane protein YdbS with pleckstrin-like domain